MLDADLAELYGVPTKRLNEAVRRNLSRFPPDFVLRLSRLEAANLRSQIATSSAGWGGPRYDAYAFTEHGVAMLASVLRSDRAVAVNIEIIRAFIRLRRREREHADLAKRIDELEGKYDASFRTVFDALRGLMRPAAPTPRPLGFRPDRERTRPRAKK